MLEEIIILLKKLTGAYPPVTYVAPGVDPTKNEAPPVRRAVGGGCFGMMIPLIAVFSILWIAGVAWYSQTQAASSVTPTIAPTVMSAASNTPTATSTAIPTLTNGQMTLTAIADIPTETPAPEVTVIVELVYVEIEATAEALEPTVAPTLTPTITPSPTPTVPAPNVLIDPRSGALGWFRAEGSQLITSGSWEAKADYRASKSGYLRAEDESSLGLICTCSAFRIGYIAAKNIGIAEIYVDGVLLDTVDGYSSFFEARVGSIYYIPAGEHLIEVRQTANRNPASSGFILAIDFMDYYTP